LDNSAIQLRNYSIVQLLNVLGERVPDEDRARSVDLSDCDGAHTRRLGGGRARPDSCGRDCERQAPGTAAVAILPGLTNTHTHLELSWLRGRVPPAATFVDWVKQLFATRGARTERPDDPKVVAAARQAIQEMREAGTSGIGDISNSLASVELIRAGGLSGVVFHELLGFNQRTPQMVRDTHAIRLAAAAAGGSAVRVSLAPHAPYSVSPELFRAIRTEVDGSSVPITSIHLAESDGEVDFLRDGSGPWPGILKFVGVARDDWSPPAMTPVEYLDSLGVLDGRTLVVHAVQLGDADLRRLAQLGCTVVTCPRSNQWVGVGVPPIERFYASGVPVAVGTDSLASVEDLNLFAELKTMRWLAPSVPARSLLDSATRVGAKALGLDDELGTIEPGKRAELIAVDLNGLKARPLGLATSNRGLANRDGEPPTSGSAADVEEYLVSGILPDQIQWVTA
jgi:cytosine/adenosine deaminase-related metal-dependent hydrolase